MSRGCLHQGKAGTKVPLLALLTRFSGAVPEGDTLAGQQRQVSSEAFLPLPSHGHAAARDPKSCVFVRWREGGSHNPMKSQPTV